MQLTATFYFESLHQISLSYDNRWRLLFKPLIIPQFYVIAKNSEKSQLVVGFGEVANSKQFSLVDLLVIYPRVDLTTITNPLICIRHGGELPDCRVSPTMDRLQEKLIWQLLEYPRGSLEHSTNK